MPRLRARGGSSDGGAPPALGDPFRVADGDQGLLPRPLRPRASWFRRTRRIAIGCAIAVWSLVAVAMIVATLFAIDAARVHRIATDGAPGLDPEIEGKETTRRVMFRSVDLDVAYTDANGVRHTGEVSFIALGAGEPVTPAVRYDPDAPAEFATSIEHERFLGRLLVHVVWIGVLLGFAVGIRTVALLRLREAADAREVIHAGGRELVLHVAEDAPEILDGRTIARRYRLVRPDGTSFECRRLADKPPFLLHVATNRVLALQHPQRPDLVVVLDPDLGPLDVEAGEVERVRVRYQAQRDAQRPA